MLFNIQSRCWHPSFTVKTLCFSKGHLALPLRCEQGSNLRGETPLDFESNALTTRPSQLCLYRQWRVILGETEVSYDNYVPSGVRTLFLWPIRKKLLLIRQQSYYQRDEVIPRTSSQKSGGINQWHLRPFLTWKQMKTSGIRTRCKMQTWRQPATLWAGFEPARGNPIGFQVQHLNHSVITAVFISVMISHSHRVLGSGQTVLATALAWYTDSIWTKNARISTWDLT